MFFFFAGALSFLLAGMGLGGGLLLVPILTVFFHIPSETARYMTLLGYLPAAAASSVRVLRVRTMREKIAVLLPAGFLGVFCGIGLASRFSETRLRSLFGILMILYGAKMLFSMKNRFFFSKK